MVLISHIIIAILSLIVAVFAVARPSSRSIKLTAALTAGTLASGVVLLFQGASVWHLCLTGIVFTSFTVVSMAIAAGRLKAAEAAL